jgi:exopolysaccharide production protein ExoY
MPDSLETNQVRTGRPALDNASTFEITDLGERHGLQPTPALVAATPVSMQMGDRPLLGRFAKRSFDLTVAVTLLILLSPILLCLAVATAIGSPGPVLFRQTRLGRGVRPFSMVKFRTMRTDAEDILHADPDLYAAFRANGYKFPKGEDPRVTKVGSFLRTSSLDEVPQLVNVVLGHMSLVGPRPPIIEQIPELYGPDVDVYYSVRPGMTGPWQISGRSNLTTEERRRMDVEYVKGRSFFGDLRILIGTIPAILRRCGAH